MKIIKIGGSILINEYQRTNIFEKLILERGSEKMLIVVSALGRYPYHFSTDGLFKLAEGFLEDFETDRLLSIGETISVLLMTKALRKMGQKVHSVSTHELGFITDNNFGNAYVLEISNDKLIDLCDGADFLVVPGFLGETEAGEVTTLGRESSDLTAVLLAEVFGEVSVTYYKDMDSINLPSDVGLIKTAVKQFSYEELLLLGTLNKSPLHAEAVTEARKESISLVIKNPKSENEIVISTKSSGLKILGINTEPHYLRLFSLNPCSLKEELLAKLDKYELEDNDIIIDTNSVLIKNEKTSLSLRNSIVRLFFS